MPFAEVRITLVVTGLYKRGFTTFHRFRGNGEVIFRFFWLLDECGLDFKVLARIIPEFLFQVVLWLITTVVSRNG